MNIQIRNVPAEVHEALTEQARASGQSLQNFLLDVVRRQAARSNNLAIMREFEGRNDGTNLSPDEVVADLQAARDSRNDELISRIFAEAPEAKRLLPDQDISDLYTLPVREPSEQGNDR